MELTKEYFDKQLKNVATKSDLTELATKNDLTELASSQSQELKPMKEHLTEIKEMVMKFDKREDEDSKAILKDLIAQQAKFTKLQDRVKKLETKNA